MLEKGGAKLAYPNSIIFPNLRAEMARKGLTIRDLAEAISVSRETVSNKLSGKTQIYLGEAFQIIERFFPDKDVAYLFAAEETVQNQRDRPA